MGSSFRLPRAQPPTDHRTPGPVLGNTGAQAHPGNGFPFEGSQRRPHSSKDQQAVGKLPGACLTRGPAAGLGNKHGKVPQAPGSEDRLRAGLQRPPGQTAELVARHSSRGGGCTSSSAGRPGLLGVPLPLPWLWSPGQKSEEARRAAPEEERGPQTPGQGCPGLCPGDPRSAWGQAGTGPSVPRTHTGPRVTLHSPGEDVQVRVGGTPTWGGRTGAPSTRLPLGAPAADQELKHNSVS